MGRAIEPGEGGEGRASFLGTGAAVGETESFLFCALLLGFFLLVARGSGGLFLMKAPTVIWLGDFGIALEIRVADQKL